MLKIKKWNSIIYIIFVTQNNKHIRVLNFPIIFKSACLVVFSIGWPDLYSGFSLECMGF
jgi:hypothetical protein